MKKVFCLGKKRVKTGVCCLWLLLYVVILTDWYNNAVVATLRNTSRNIRKSFYYSFFRNRENEFGEWISNKMSKLQENGRERKGDEKKRGEIGKVGYLMLSSPFYLYKVIPFLAGALKRHQERLQ